MNKLSILLNLFIILVCVCSPGLSTRFVSEAGPGSNRSLLGQNSSKGRVLSTGGVHKGWVKNPRRALRESKTRYPCSKNSSGALSL